MSVEFCLKDIRFVNTMYFVVYLMVFRVLLICFCMWTIKISDAQHNNLFVIFFYFVDNKQLRCPHIKTRSKCHHS